jgi:hypothetical protein
LVLALVLAACDRQTASFPIDTVDTRGPTYVCFILRGDWSGAGEFQRLLVKPEGMREGISGFRLAVGDDSAFLEVTLEEDVDAAAWIASLPTEVSRHRALVAVTARNSTCGQ